MARAGRRRFDTPLHRNLEIRDDPDGHECRARTRIRHVLANSVCTGSEWSRSSLMTGYLPERGVYKRVCSRSKIYVALIIIIITSNLIHSSISTRPGVALSLKNLLIQHSLLDPTTNLSPTIKMVRITAAAVLACEYPVSHPHGSQTVANLTSSQSPSPPSPWPPTTPALRALVLATVPSSPPAAALTTPTASPPAAPRSPPPGLESAPPRPPPPRTASSAAALSTPTPTLRSLLPRPRSRSRASKGDVFYEYMLGL